MPTGTRGTPPTGALRVAIQGHLQPAVSYVNVLWFMLTSGGPLLADLNTLVDALVADWHTAFGGDLSADWTVEEATAAWQTSPTTVLGTARSYSLAGSGGAAVDAGQLCAVINWIIARSYRGGHPRTYLPGLQTGDVSQGKTLQSASRSALAADANSFLAAANAETAGAISAVEFGTVSFVDGGAFRVTPVFEAYVGATCRSNVGTQRRRVEP